MVVFTQCLMKQLPLELVEFYLCESRVQNLNTGLQLWLARNKLEREVAAASGVWGIAVGAYKLCHLISQQKYCCRPCLYDWEGLLLLVSYGLSETLGIQRKDWRDEALLLLTSLEMTSASISSFLSPLFLLIAAVNMGLHMRRALHLSWAKRKFLSREPRKNKVTQWKLKCWTHLG